MNYYKDIIYGRMRYTAEIEINYCVLRQNKSLDISYPLGTSFTTYCNGSRVKVSVSNLFYSESVKFYRKKSMRIQETDSTLESRCDYFHTTSGKS